MVFVVQILRRVASIVFLLSCWFYPYELDSNGGLEAGIASVPDYLMREMRYVLMSAGKLEAEMFSHEAEFHLESQTLYSKEVHGDFYNEQGEVTKLQGDSADYHMQKRFLHLLGNVVCETPDHFFLRGPEADYDLNKKFFRVPHDVSGNTEDQAMKFWADRGESYVDTKTANLFGNARAEHKNPKQGLTKVRGDRALIDRNEEAVTFFDNTKIHQDKYDVDSHSASLFYSKSSKQVQYMVAREDVRIREQGGRNTRSQEAQFYTPTNTIVLTGFPSVYDGEDVVTGDRITLYRSTGVVEVTSANAAMSDATLTTKPSEREKQKKRKKEEDEPLSEEDQELIP